MKMQLAFWRPRHPVSDDDLSALLDGALSGRAAGVQAHVDDCAACREKLVGLGAVRSALSELPHARAPRSFALREADVVPQPRPGPAGGFAGAQALLGGVVLVSAVVFLVLVGFDASGGSMGNGGGAGKGEPTGVLSSQGAYDTSSQESRNAGGATQADERAETPSPSENGDGFSEGTLPMTGTPNCESALCAEQPNASTFGPEPTSAPAAPSIEAATSEGEDDDNSLRAAEAAAAGVALAAGGALAFVWWRRRA